MKKKIQLFVTSMLIVLGLVSVALQPVYADCDPGNGLVGGVDCAKNDNQPQDFFGPSGIFTKIVNFMLFFVGIISVIMIIYAGIQYTTSAGDSGKVTNAKNTILYAIIGLIVAILAYAIVNFVTNTFLSKS